MSLIRSNTLIDDGDVNTQHVMLLIDKGIRKKLRLKNTPRAVFAWYVYEKIKPLRFLAYMGLFLLTFFEKPAWCVLNPDTTNSSYCLSAAYPRKYPGSGNNHLLLNFIPCRSCVSSANSFKDDGALALDNGQFLRVSLDRLSEEH